MQGPLRLRGDGGPSDESEGSVEDEDETSRSSVHKLEGHEENSEVAFDITHCHPSLPPPPPRLLFLNFTLSPGNLEN